MYVSVGIYLALLLTQGVKQRLIICLFQLFVCERLKESKRMCIWHRHRDWGQTVWFVCVCVREKLCRQKREIADKDPC